MAQRVPGRADGTKKRNFRNDAEEVLNAIVGDKQRHMGAKPIQSHRGLISLRN